MRDADTKNIIRPPVPIVGIGASAGGLAPLLSLLTGLPAQFGFAIVFVQHLSAKHGSLLPGLLKSSRSDMEILQITDGLQILTGRLYLAPPGSRIAVRNGLFQAASAPGGHARLPIDDFFASLAEETGEGAIGVILSGAGTDGARGVRAIGVGGGTVLVQEPATAEFAAMPLAAIGTGMADSVLPPADIAAEIVKLLGAPSVAAPDTDDITPEEFNTFCRVIKEQTGHHFDHYKKSVVTRRIRRRMHLRSVAAVRDYLQLLADGGAEADAMTADLMIGVTSFFRDRLAWKALKTAVIRKLSAAAGNSPIRVWTPACATGEEAYSIAMLLLDELGHSGTKREIQVFATDVSGKALNKAREGKYPASIVADLPPEFGRRFFTSSRDRLSVTVSKEIRERVIFARQDLLTDPPFSRLDLIICRNLLIYLEPRAQERCFALFHYALKEGGCLFLGNAESISGNNVLFTPLSHKKCRIYQKIEIKQTARLPFAVPFTAEGAALPLPGEKPGAREPSAVGIAQENLLERYAPAAVAINQNYEIIYHNGPTNKFLRQPRGVPTSNLIELLPENLRARVRGAIQRTPPEGKPVVLRVSLPGERERKKQIMLRISRLREHLFLVVFHEKDPQPERRGADTPEAACDEPAVRQLESELSATRVDLQNRIEELRSLNEELQSSNEELQAANEELETSREELQSLNEELTTLNSQLQAKIEEEEEINNDLTNFLAGTNIPTLFLDQRLRVRRFTPAMLKLLKLLPADAGRPINDLSQEGLGPELIADAEAVLHHLSPIRREILIRDTWHVRTAIPYRTGDNRIEGVVVTYADISELKKAEQINGRLAAIVESADDAIISKDLNGIITTWNVGAEKIFGFTAGEAVGRNISFLLPPGHQDEVPDILKKIARGGHIERFETERLRKDGAIIPVSLTFSPIKDAHGRIIGASKIAHDITDRKRAEKELIRLNRTLKALGENRKAVMLADDESRYLNEVCRIIVDECGYKMVWIGLTENDEAKTVRPAAYAGFDAGYLQTLNITWADNERGRGPTGIAIRTGKPAMCRNMLTDPVFAPWREQAIKRGYASSIVFPLMNAGKAFGAITIYSREADPFTDDEIRLLTELADDLAYGIITLWIRAAHDQAIQALRESEEKYRSLFANITEEVHFWELVRDEAGRIKTWKLVDANPPTLKTWGKTLEEIRGKTSDEIFGPGATEHYIDIVQKIIREGVPFSFEDYFPNLGKYFRFTSVPFGEYFITTGADITDMKKAEESLRHHASELEAANRELEAFSYSVSHDLRAPLRSVGGFSQVLLEDYADRLDEEGKGYLGRIVSGTQRMAQLIDDLLNLSRLTRTQMKRAPLDLSGMVRKIAEGLAETEPERQVDFRIAVSARAEGDEHLLNLALANLLSNAFKFTANQAKAVIEFGASEHEGEKVFFVRDNGTGFDNAYAGKLFKPFQRLHSQKEFSGTGIGLAIVKRVINRHGGKVWIEGEPGKGATVSFTLE